MIAVFELTLEFTFNSVAFNTNNIEITHRCTQDSTNELHMYVTSSTSVHLNVRNKTNKFTYIKYVFILYYKLRHVSTAFAIIIRVGFNSTKNTKNISVINNISETIFYTIAFFCYMSLSSNALLNFPMVLLRYFINTNSS
jgi:hypothetical protein